jgi:hypothetical protein
MFHRSKGTAVDILQIYRDCNAASHYLEDSLTTTKVKGPLRGKNLVSFLDSLVISSDTPLVIMRVHC